MGVRCAGDAHRPEICDCQGIQRWGNGMGLTLGSALQALLHATCADFIWKGILAVLGMALGLCFLM